VFSIRCLFNSKLFKGTESLCNVSVIIKYLNSTKQCERSNSCFKKNVILILMELKLSKDVSASGLKY